LAAVLFIARGLAVFFVVFLVVFLVGLGGIGFGGWGFCGALAITRGSAVFFVGFFVGLSVLGGLAVFFVDFTGLAMAAALFVTTTRFTVLIVVTGGFGIASDGVRLEPRLRVWSRCYGEHTIRLREVNSGVLSTWYGKDSRSCSQDTDQEDNVLKIAHIELISE